MLSAVRAYVGGEGLWSKAQKEAVAYLARYARAGREADFSRFEAAIAVPLGDRRAREALERDSPDYAAAREGFIAGRNHPDDVEAMSRLFVHGRHLAYLERAIGFWAEGDELIAQLVKLSAEIRAERQGGANPQRLEALLLRLSELNDRLMPLEDGFSATLGEASRWAQGLLFGVFLALGAALIGGAGWIYAGEVARTARAEAALRAADRQKDDFLATLAHELRNPLAPIRSTVELLRRRELAGELAWARDVLDRQSGHLARLVDDLLNVSRITRGKLELRKERLPLAAPIRDAIEEVRPLTTARRVGLSVSLPPEELVVEADPTRVTQIIANLLSNAAKFTPEGGAIVVEALAGGGDALVRVRDSGSGFAPERLEGLFDMFSQGTPSLERTQGGLGIGLALARGLARLHGGDIEAKSDGPGRGAEFTLRLPRL